MATLKEMQDAVKFHAEAGNVEAVRALIAAIRAEQAKATAAAAELDDPGVGQTLLIGAGRTFDRIGKGVKQGYLALKGDDAGLEQLKEDAAEDDRVYKPLQEARPWATGIGESLPLVAVPGGAGATLASKAGTMALGAAVPAALEYGTPEERLKRAALAGGAGAATTGALALAGKVGKAGYGAIRGMLDPVTDAGQGRIVGRALRRAAGEAPDAVATRLDAASPLVPGSAPTTAQVAESGGLAALERSAKSANPDQFTVRAREQAGARVAALRSVAGDEAELAAARTTRSEAAKRSYKHAYMAGVDQEMADALAPQIKELLTRPSVKSAMGQAKRIAKEESINVSDFGSVQGLHFLKEALDDQISGLVKSPKMQRRVLQTKNDLMSVLEQIAPEYAVANQRFAQLSKPINRMEVGQKMLEKVEPALNDWGGMSAQTAATAARALRDADALTRQATGFRGAKYNNVLEPAHRDTVEGIMRDLARGSNAETLGRGSNSDTAQKLAFSNLVSRTGSPQAAKTLFNLPGVRHLGHWLYQQQEENLTRQLTEALLDPKLAARLIRDGGKSGTRKLLDALDRKTGVETAVRDALESSPKILKSLKALRNAAPTGLPAAPAIAATSGAASDPVRNADDLQGEYLD